MIGWTDVAIIFATLLGPVLAVQAQKWLERGRAEQERRLAIFRTLMATRAYMLSPEHVQALNAIPVEFYGKSKIPWERKRLKAINDAWMLFLDHHQGDPPQTDAWAQRRVDLFIKLLFLVSQYLDYEFDEVQLKRNFYSPRAHSDLELEHTTIRQGLAQLFRGEATLPMSVKEFPAMTDDEGRTNQNALQRTLLEVLDGTRAIKVEAQFPEEKSS